MNYTATSLAGEPLQLSGDQIALFDKIMHAVKILKQQEAAGGYSLLDYAIVSMACSAAKFVPISKILTSSFLQNRDQQHPHTFGAVVNGIVAACFGNSGPLLDGLKEIGGNGEGDLVLFGLMAANLEASDIAPSSIVRAVRRLAAPTCQMRLENIAGRVRRRYGSLSVRGMRDALTGTDLVPGRNKREKVRNAYKAAVSFLG